MVRLIWNGQMESGLSPNLQLNRSRNSNTLSDAIKSLPVENNSRQAFYQDFALFRLSIREKGKG